MTDCVNFLTSEIFMSVEQKEHTLEMAECADLVEHYCEQLTGYVNELSDAVGTEGVSRDGVRAVLARSALTLEALGKVLSSVAKMLERGINDWR